MTRLLIAGVIPGPSTFARYLRPNSGEEITLLLSVPAGWPARVIEHSCTCREHHIPRGELYADHYQPSESVDPHLIALARTARYDEALRRAFVTLAEQADVIVHTAAALFDIDEHGAADGKVRIYAPEGGPEYLTACGDAPASEQSWQAFPVYALESRLVAAADRIVTATPEHRHAFERWYDCPPRTAPRRHIVVVNDYRLDTPGGGGHVRLRELHESVCAAGLQASLICFSDAAERRDTALAPHFHQIAIPKEAPHRQLQHSVDTAHPNSAADVTSLLCCPENATLEREFRAAMVTADAVVFEHAYMAPLIELVPTGVPVVYSAHNVETVLKASVYAGHPLRRTLTEAVRLAEEELVSEARALVCVSPEDAAHFRGITGKPVHVIENGVRFDENWTAAETRDGVAFIGSAHPPNIEAVRFVLSNIAPRLPDVRFRIVGSVEAALGQLLAEGISVTPNVTFTGPVSTERKNQILRRSAVGLNPMFSGSGSNLKLPEYFAARLPALSTAFGARGFEVTDGVHLRIAEADDFADVLRRMLADAQGQSALVDAAWQYARDRLSWHTLGVRLRDILLGLMDPERERTLILGDHEGDVSVQGNGEAIGFPALARHVPDLRPNPEAGFDAAAEDAALRSCSAVSPETERFVSLYSRVITGAAVHGGPHSATGRAARLLQLAGVALYTPVTEVMEKSS